jgi:hypothetical protein
MFFGFSKDDSTYLSDEGSGNLLQVCLPSSHGELACFAR